MKPKAKYEFRIVEIILFYEYIVQKHYRNENLQHIFEDLVPQIFLGFGITLS
jgi:hypothetical protein